MNLLKTYSTEECKNIADRVIKSETKMVYKLPLLYQVIEEYGDEYLLSESDESVEDFM